MTAPAPVRQQPDILCHERCATPSVVACSRIREYSTVGAVHALHHGLHSVQRRVRRSEPSHRRSMPMLHTFHTAMRLPLTRDRAFNSLNTELRGSVEASLARGILSS